MFLLNNQIFPDAVQRISRVKYENFCLFEIETDGSF